MSLESFPQIEGVQSDHTRQVAAVTAHVGLRCVLVQESWVDWHDAVYDKVGTSCRAGSPVLTCGWRAPGSQSVRGEPGAGAARGRGAGGTAYPMPAGASDHELGGLGFAGWAYQLVEQERELGVFFDTVIV